MSGSQTNIRMAQLANHSATMPLNKQITFNQILSRIF